VYSCNITSCFEQMSICFGQCRATIMYDGFQIKHKTCISVAMMKIWKHCIKFLFVLASASYVFARILKIAAVRCVLDMTIHCIHIHSCSTHFDLYNYKSLSLHSPHLISLHMCIITRTRRLSPPRFLLFLLLRRRLLRPPVVHEDWMDSLRHFLP